MGPNPLQSDSCERWHCHHTMSCDLDSMPSEHLGFTSVSQIRRTVCRPGCTCRAGEPHSHFAAGRSDIDQVAFQQVAFYRPNIAECAAAGVVISESQSRSFLFLHGKFFLEPEIRLY